MSVSQVDTKPNSLTMTTLLLRLLSTMFLTTLVLLVGFRYITPVPCPLAPPLCLTYTLIGPILYPRLANDDR